MLRDVVLLQVRESPRRHLTAKSACCLHGDGEDTRILDCEGSRFDGLIGDCEGEKQPKCGSQELLHISSDG